MRIVLTGLSHRTAPIEAREALSLTGEALPAALETLARRMGRGVILSTCNRTEVYTLARDLEHGVHATAAFVEAQFGVAIDRVRPYLYAHEQDRAAAHLFRVSSGLDSQIVGEPEILGQVREAFSAATRRRTAGGALAHLFHSAIRTGKRARTETAIGRNALSVSRACVELARRTVGPLACKRALVLGAGEVARLAGTALRDVGVRGITVANRTPANATDLARALGADLAPLDDLAALLAGADVVVTATAAPECLLPAGLVEEAVSRRGGEPLVLLDVAVPRDVAPEAGGLPGVHLFTLDDLRSAAEANRAGREAEIGRAEAIVAEEVERFRAWRESRGVTPTIAALRHRAEEVRAREFAATIGRLHGLSDEDAARIDRMTRALVKKLLHAPTDALRARNDDSYTQTARDLFGLDEVRAG